VQECWSTPKLWPKIEIQDGGRRSQSQWRPSQTVTDADERFTSATFPDRRKTTRTLPPTSQTWVLHPKTGRLLTNNVLIRMLYRPKELLTIYSSRWHCFFLHSTATVCFYYLSFYILSSSSHVRWCVLNEYCIVLYCNQSLLLGL